MTKKEFIEYQEQNGFDDALIELENECDELTDTELLKEYAIKCIVAGDYQIAAHICAALHEFWVDDFSEVWLYDYNMGTLEEPTPVEDFEDIEHLLEDESEVA